MSALRPVLVAVVVASVVAACGAHKDLDPGNAGVAGAAGVTGSGGASAAGGAPGGASGMVACPAGGTAGAAAGAGGHGGEWVSDPPCPGSGFPDCVGSGPVCGDGVVQTCLIPQTFGFCQKAAVGQWCDGADLGTHTCQSQGFGSGTLACSATCTLDVSGCSPCTADASVLRCGAAPGNASDTSVIALGATDTEVAQAWAEQGSSGPPVLRFARLSPNLDVVSTTPLDDPAFAAATDGFSAGVSLFVEPLPSGWVVAGYAEPDVFVHAIDAAGHGVSRLRLATVSGAATTLLPITAARPGGGPLVVWTKSGVVSAAVISADGRSATPPITLPIDTTRISGIMSAAFVVDSFFVATAVVDDPTNAVSSHLRLVRIAADGSSATAFDALPGANIADPYIIAGTDPGAAGPAAGALRIVYSGTLPCEQQYRALTQRVSATGAALSAPVPFGDRDAGYLADRPLALAGGDTVSLILGLDLHSLAVERNAPDGRPAAPVRVFALGPGQSYQRSFARRGPDVVAAWLSTDAQGAQLARVAP